MSGSRASEPGRRAARSDGARRLVPGAWTACTAVVIALCGAIAAGCASNPFTTRTTPEGVFLVNETLGYAISRPPWADEPGWRPVDIEEADLAWTDGRGTTISLGTSCPRTRASVPMLARHVAIGTERTSVLSTGPDRVDGAPGWTQTFDTVENGATVRVKAVTAQAGGCVYDWLLVSPSTDRFARLEPRFDDWVASWRPPPGAGEAGSDEAEGSGAGDAMGEGEGESTGDGDEPAETGGAS